MKVKEMITCLESLKPDEEILCFGDGGFMHTNLLILHYSETNEVWICGTYDNITEDINTFKNNDKDNEN